jgi:two-component system chemotaxis response regulator CheB
VIKLLVVDDSALMRRHLTQIFESAGGFEVVQARNGAEAVELNKRLAPDVVTLDINMPEVDGLTALSLMMAERPVPVVMVSSLTERGALATFEALNLGAVDFVLKPGGTISLSIRDVGDEIVAKVRAAATARVSAPRARAPVRPATTLRAKPPAASPLARVDLPGLVLVGVSTGGPRTLEQILGQLSGQFPWPIVVAQHMPATFTRSFAARLDQSCGLNVVEVASPMPVQAGTVYIAKGGADLVLAMRGAVLTAVPKPENAQHLWHPSVELLGRSALAHCDPKSVIGVMLTGMGHDGAESFTEIKRQGGRTIAESESTCVVYGMPKELIERRGASLVLPSDKIAAQLSAWAAR